MKSFLILILIVIKTFSLQSTSNPSLSGRLGGAGTLAFYYADKGEWSKTDSITNMMDTIYEKQNEAIVIEVYKALKQNGENIYNLVSDTLLQQKIMQVVNDSTRKGYAAAISILQQVFGRVYYEPINDDGGEENRSMILANNVLNNAGVNDFIMCYPNPTNQIINFNINYLTVQIRE